MAYIATLNNVPVVLDTLRDLLPNYSFPAEELTSTSDYADAITAAGYEVCTITNAATDVSPAWNQKVVLGAATRNANGDLEAAYTTASMTAQEETDALTTIKEVATADVDTRTEAVRASAQTFSSGTGGSDPAVSLRPDDETITNLTKLMVVAQNANSSSVTLRDADGASVTLTLAQLKYLTAAAVETEAELVADRAIATAAISSATTGTAVTTAVSTFETSQPDPGASS